MTAKWPQKAKENWSIRHRLLRARPGVDYILVTWPYLTVRVTGECHPPVALKEEEMGWWTASSVYYMTVNFFCIFQSTFSTHTAHSSLLWTWNSPKWDIAYFPYICFVFSHLGECLKFLLTKTPTSSLLGLHEQCCLSLKT